MQALCPYQKSPNFYNINASDFSEQYISLLFLPHSLKYLCISGEKGEEFHLLFIKPDFG